MTPVVPMRYKGTFHKIVITHIWLQIKTGFNHFSCNYKQNKSDFYNEGISRFFLWLNVYTKVQPIPNTTVDYKK